MEKSRILYWQMVWFFSWEAPVQATLIGSVKNQWFIEENDDNLGANYLIGLCLALVEGDRPDDLRADALRETILKVSENLDPAYWVFQSLGCNVEWVHARLLASELLNALSPRVAPPRKPFSIEDILHVEHYQHAREVRKQLRKVNPRANQ